MHPLPNQRRRHFDLYDCSDFDIHTESHGTWKHKVRERMLNKRILKDDNSFLIISGQKNYLSGVGMTFVRAFKRCYLIT